MQCISSFFSQICARLNTIPCDLRAISDKTIKYHNVYSMNKLEYETKTMILGDLATTNTYVI